MLKKRMNIKPKAFVLDALIRWPETRSNDIMLYRLYGQQVYGTTDLRILETLRKNELESVRRARQKIQQTNPLLAKPETKAARAEEEKRVRKEMKGL